MGQEIDSVHFRKRDFDAFDARLREETRILDEWFREGVFVDEPYSAGYEVETCLIDALGQPAPLNAQFLEKIVSPMVVPELSRFNLELNSYPHRLCGSVLRDSHRELEDLRLQCDRVATRIDTRMIMAGIVPTLREDQLNLECMSGMHRYRALNEQVLRLRGGRPMSLDIRGRDHLNIEHGDLMLEAATTSFQIHLQVPPPLAARIYNLSLFLSAPMVAVAANSPYAFGHDLWEESRIPLFEQAVSVAGPGSPERVGFGEGYVGHLMECFNCNLNDYPALLPTELSDEPSELPHLRLHNGTIWRWNRPLIGFSESGKPHLRIEHRVLPAGPSIADSIANAALYFGLISHLAGEGIDIDKRISFDQVRTNFYRAARHGMSAELDWYDGRRLPVKDLVLNHLLPQAKRGLQALDIDAADIREYLGIIKARSKSGQNGSHWQRAYVRQHHATMQELTEAYVARQLSGSPVHEWGI